MYRKATVLIVCLYVGLVAGPLPYGSVWAADGESSRPSGSQNATRPNILYFYVDDMGWGSIGPNGQAERRSAGLPAVHTPNLDELARQGMNFTRGYGCFVCSPARSSQQTGFHQGHTFADRNDPNNAKKAIRREDITMGDALSAAGYVTGYWGKWGYGGSKDQQDPVIENVQTLPTSHGYQHVLAELHHVRAHTFFQPTLWHAPAPANARGGLKLVPNRLTKYRNTKAYPAAPANQNHAEYPATAYCDDTYSFAALDFVREQAIQYRRTGKPFFGLLAAQIPHAPFDEVAKLPLWNEAYRDDPHFSSLPKQSQQWAAMVTRIDAHIGNILSALEDPNNDGDQSDSIVADTLVVFQSDNGGPGGSNNESYDANGALSGTKGRIQEGGIRVPLVMRWPGKIAGGSTHVKPVDVTDLLPTFCELAGESIPLGIDGVSLAPTLTGLGHQNEREYLIHEASNGYSIIRGDHKLVLPVTKQKKQLVPGRVRLFDLAKDPSESNDIAAAHPNLTEELKALLLGERVNEPKGFANTYHQWTGKDGADATLAENWSVYEYTNAGVSYQKDDGAPQLSWVAKMHNRNNSSCTAMVTNDLSVLALSIAGHDASASQTLMVTSGIHVTARNELRVQPFGHLLLQGGEITTLRWVSIAPDAILSGSGSLNGDILHHGTLSVSDQGMVIHGDLSSFPISTLNMSSASTLIIDGNANLSGKLLINAPIADGETMTLLKAAKIEGKFNTNDPKYRITYTDTEVKVTAVAVQ